MCRKTHERWRQVPFAPRKNIVKLVRRDTQELSGTNERVLCCFAGDMYSPEAVATGIGRLILGIFRAFNVPFQVLTKGGMRAVADFDLYGLNDAFATTLTYMDTECSRREEPGAALPDDRIHAIEVAYGRGIETWVSLEPVLDPEESLRLICATHHAVRLYKIGKLNHDTAREKEIDWRAFGMEAIALCEKYGRPYYIKDDLAKHLSGVTFHNTDTRRVVRP